MKSPQEFGLFQAFSVYYFKLFTYGVYKLLAILKVTFIPLNVVKVVVSQQQSCAPLDFILPHRGRSEKIMCLIRSFYYGKLFNDKTSIIIFKSVKFNHRQH